MNKKSGAARYRVVPRNSPLLMLNQCKNRCNLDLKMLRLCRNFVESVRVIYFRSFVGLEVITCTRTEPFVLVQNLSTEEIFNKGGNFIEHCCVLSLPGSLHLTCSATNGAEPNYSTSTIGLMSPGAAGNLVHYQSNSNQHQQQQHLHDCMPQSQHIVVPVNGDLLGLRPVTSNGGNQNLLFSSGLPQVSGAGTVSSSNVHHQQQATHHQSNQQSSQQQHHVRSTGNHDEAIRKREVRLLKNSQVGGGGMNHLATGTETWVITSCMILNGETEAAKECRRKKKEYVKCLENRVAALEQQNKQLIEELKTLKDLYCQKGD
uniref:BZIP domain-containing protein n=1 Tax=Romanomermis culicivorax TaxID=13658 RepID=A0A915L0W5_ROMCU